MNTEDEEGADTGRHIPQELTRDEAREKRAHHLALYREYAEAERRTDTDQVDAADSTMATFILPGD